MRTFNHFGVPTTTPQPNANYVESLRVHLTDYSLSPNKIEYLRFEAGSCMPELIQTVPHIAYEVACLESELAGAKVLVEPMKIGDQLTIAFIEEEGIPIELMYIQK